MQEARTLRLTAIGRRTGLPRTVKLGFLYHNSKVYLSGEDTRHWCRNILKNPDVVLDVGGRLVEGRARLMERSALRSEVIRLYLVRYRSGLLSQLFDQWLETRWIVEVAPKEAP